MILPLRSRHRWLWLVLAVLLPTALVGALLARTPRPLLPELPSHTGDSAAVNSSEPSP